MATKRLASEFENDVPPKEKRMKRMSSYVNNKIVDFKCVFSVDLMKLLLENTG